MTARGNAPMPMGRGVPIDTAQIDEVPRSHGGGLSSDTARAAVETGEGLPRCELSCRSGACERNLSDLTSISIICVSCQGDNRSSGPHGTYRDRSRLPACAWFGLRCSGSATPARVASVPVYASSPLERSHGVAFSRTGRRPAGTRCLQHLPDTICSMAAYSCSHCRDARWVCERHQTSPYPHGTCDAPGKPCPFCQPPDQRPELPPDRRSLADLTKVGPEKPH